MFNRLKKWHRYNRRRYQLTSEGGYYEIWRVAYPLIIMNASQTVMQVCNRKFLSYHSTMDVAAALPAGILAFLVFSFFVVTLGFTASIVSQFFGRKDRASCVKAAWNGFYVSLLMSLVLMLVMPFIGTLVIGHSGHDPMVAQRENQYYLALVPCGIFACLGQPFFSYFSGQGKTWYVAAIQSAICLINIALDYVLIFGKLGLPSLGIVGAGIATSISTGLAMVTIMTMFLLQDQQQRPTRSHCRYDLSTIKRLLRYGLPSGARCFLDVGAFTAFTFIVGMLSKEGLAVSTIICTINMLSFMPLMGFADAAGILLGQYIGKNNLALAEKTVWRTLWLGVVYVSVIAAIYLIMPHWLVTCFAPGKSNEINFAEVVSMGTILLMMMIIMNYADTCRLVFLGALCGAGDTKAVLLISVVGRWFIMVPCVVVMVRFYHASVIEIWAFWIGSRIAEGAATYWRFRSGVWQRIKMLGHPPVPELPLIKDSAVETDIP